MKGHSPYIDRISGKELEQCYVLHDMSYSNRFTLDVSAFNQSDDKVHIVFIHCKPFKTRPPRLSN